MISSCLRKGGRSANISSIYHRSKLSGAETLMIRVVTKEKEAHSEWLCDVGLKDLPFLNRPQRSPYWMRKTFMSANIVLFVG